MNYGWMFVTLYRRQGSRPFPRKRNAKKQNVCLGRLTNSCEKKRSQKQRRKGRYTHLNAGFQRIAKRDKKAFFSKEIEENNRMGKTKELLKKIRDTKETFYAKMGTIKGRNGMDHLVMSVCRVFSCVVGCGIYYDQCILLAKLY